MLLTAAVPFVAYTSYIFELLGQYPGLYVPALDKVETKVFHHVRIEHPLSRRMTHRAQDSAMYE